MIDWLTVKQIEWLNNWLKAYRTEGLIITDWLTENLSSWLTNYPINWLTGWLDARLTDWLSVKLAGRPDLIT